MQELGRFRVLDEKPVNLDGFSVADADLGLVAMHSPHDPIPSLVIDNGVVTELDGKSAADFDVIDEFIARYGIDLAVADEAMALDDAVLARMAVDVNVPRAEVVRLIGGTTPAKLARVVALMSPVEMQMAMAKMRARRTPSNQAHVTNQLDDPLLIAADAASAVSYGFREVETTVPVLGDAADQVLGQRFVVADLEQFLGGLVSGQFLAERLERRGRGGEAQVGLVRGEGEQEARLDEEGRAPLDGLPGLGCHAPQQRAQAPQVRMGLGRGGGDVVVDRGGRLAGHLVHPLRVHPPWRCTSFGERPNLALKARLKWLRSVKPNSSAACDTCRTRPSARAR